MRVYLLIMVLSAAVTYLTVPAVLHFALATGAISRVRGRDVHVVPIARFGGVAMFLGLLTAFLAAAHIPFLADIFAAGSSAWGILYGAGLMCAVGALDDLWELTWYAKLAGEVLAAGVMAWFDVQLLSLPLLGLTVGSQKLALVGTVIVVVAVVNAVNFIDGLDGLAAGVIGISALAFFVYTYFLIRESSPGDYASVASVAASALVGMCAGFLPHNFHPAKIFMGDSGALTLGTIISGAAIVVTGQIDPANLTADYAIPAVMPLLVPVLILFIPLFDMTWAVVRRLARGQSPFAADAGHLHHRLLRRGHSHRKAVLILYLWAGVFSFTAVSFVIFPARYVVFPALAVLAVSLLVSMKALEVKNGVAGR